MIPTPPESVACLLQTLLHKFQCEGQSGIQTAHAATAANLLAQPDRELSPGISHVCANGSAPHKPSRVAQQRARPMGDSSVQPITTAGTPVKPKRARPLRADQLADKYLAKRLKALQQNKQKGTTSHPVPAMPTTLTGPAAVRSAEVSGWAIGKQLQQQTQQQHVDTHPVQSRNELEASSAAAAPGSARQQAVRDSGVQQQTIREHHVHIAPASIAAADKVDTAAAAAEHDAALQQQQQQPPAATPVMGAHAQPAAPVAAAGSDDNWLQLWDARLQEEEMNTASAYMAAGPGGFTAAAAAADESVLGVNSAATVHSVAAGPAGCIEAAVQIAAHDADILAAGGAGTSPTAAPEQGEGMMRLVSVPTPPVAASLSPSAAAGQEIVHRDLIQVQVQPPAAAARLSGQHEGAQQQGCQQEQQRQQHQQQQQQQHGQQCRPQQRQYGVEQLFSSTQEQQQSAQDHLVQQVQMTAVHLVQTADNAVSPEPGEAAATDLQVSANSMFPQGQQAVADAPPQPTAAQAPSAAPQPPGTAAGHSAAGCAAAGNDKRFTLASLLFAMPELPIKQVRAAGSTDRIVAAAGPDKPGRKSPAAALPALGSTALARRSTPPAGLAEVASVAGIPAGSPRTTGHKQRQQQQHKQRNSTSLQAAGAEQHSFGAGVTNEGAAAVNAGTAADEADSSSEKGEVAAGSDDDHMDHDIRDDMACDVQDGTAAAAATATGAKRKRKKSRGGRQVRQRQQRAEADKAAAAATGGKGSGVGSAQGLYAEIKQWEKKNNNRRKHKTAPVDGARDLRFTITDKPPCKFWQMGRCTKGSDCPYPHSGQPASKLIACKFYQRGQCKHGDECRFSHEPVSRQPCPDMVLYHKCVRGRGGCQYSHEDLEPEVAESLRRMLLKMQEDEQQQPEQGTQAQQQTPPQSAVAQTQQQAMQQQGLLGYQQLQHPPWQQQAAQQRPAAPQQHWQPHQQLQQQHGVLPQFPLQPSPAGYHPPQHQQLGLVQHPQHHQVVVPSVVGHHLMHYNPQQAYQQQQQQPGQHRTGQVMPPR